MLNKCKFRIYEVTLKVQREKNVRTANKTFANAEQKLDLSGSQRSCLPSLRNWKIRVVRNRVFASTSWKNVSWSPANPRIRQHRTAVSSQAATTSGTLPWVGSQRSWFGFSRSYCRRRSCSKDSKPWS